MWPNTQSTASFFFLLLISRPFGIELSCIDAIDWIELSPYAELFATFMYCVSFKIPAKRKVYIFCMQCLRVSCAAHRNLLGISYVRYFQLILHIASDSWITYGYVVTGELHKGRHRHTLRMNMFFVRIASHDSRKWLFEISLSNKLFVFDMRYFRTLIFYLVSF